MTDKQRDVLRYMAAGKSYWVIGELMNISKDRVKQHAHNIYAKLGTNERSAAVVRSTSGTSISVSAI